MADESGRAKRYKTARALEMALKEAARRSGRDVNRAMADFWHGRLLERVFSEDDPSFVLKGGRGMLARTPSARYTRDTDMAYGGADADEAVSELRRLAAIDLGDHVEYRFMSESPMSRTRITATGGASSSGACSAARRRSRTCRSTWS